MTVYTKLITPSKIEKPESERRITTATIALACITGLLALFTGGLWIATYRLVSESKKTAKQQLRAYISVETAPKTDFAGNVIVNEILLVVHNSGQTPAHKLTSWVDCQLLEYPWNKPFHRPDEKTITEMTSVLNPDKKTCLIPNPNIPIPDDINIRKITAGTHAIYIWGEIGFDDVFDDHRTVTFCYFMNLEGHRHQRFSTYKDKNTAT